MGYIRSISKLSAISIIVSQAFITVPVFAAGFQLDETSPSLQGAAMAGAAAACNDVSALFNNPATLTTLQENQFYIGGSEIIPHVTMNNASATHTVNIPGIPPSSISAVVLGRHKQGNFGQSGFDPAAYLSWRINDCLVAGIAIVGPFGLTTNYSNDSVARFVSKYSAVRSADIVPSLAYEINRQWSVGLGFQAQYLKATLSNFAGPYTGDPAIDALVAATQPTYLKADGWGYGYTLGVLYKPDQCTRLGIGYRSMISERISGNGWQYTSPGPTVPAPSRDFLFNAKTHDRAATKTPAVLTFGAARDINNWTVKGTVQVNFWNTFRHLSINMPDAFATNTTINTSWRTAWMGSVGADYRATCNWTVRGGVAYDQTPTINKRRDSRIPDANRVWLTLGTTYYATKHLSFDGAYEHIFIKNQKVDVTQASGSNAISTRPLEVNRLKAHYRGSANILAVAIRYSFC